MYQARAEPGYLSHRGQSQGQCWKEEDQTCPWALSAWGPPLTGGLGGAAVWEPSKDMGRDDGNSVTAPLFFFLTGEIECASGKNLVKTGKWTM